MENFDPVIELLRASRPELAPSDLDRVYQRSKRKGDKRVRLLTVSLISMGMLFSMAGGVGAIISDSDSAAKIQYPEVQVAPETGKPLADGGEVLGEKFEGKKTLKLADTSGDNPRGMTALKADKRVNKPATGTEKSVVQAVSQVTAGGGTELPFTGFMAIPVLLGGLGLLITGLALRVSQGRS